MSYEEDIKYSLLIATLDRHNKLAECLRFLNDQTYRNFEVIIVDQTSEPFNMNKEGINFRCEYIHIKERGLSHARNIGIDVATGDYICLVDDDSLYSNDILLKATEIIKQSRPVILTGNIKDPITSDKKYPAKSTKIDYMNAFSLACSSSMIIQKDFLVKNKFDEVFGIGAKYSAGEETDIIFAALCGKNSVLYTNQYEVLHKIEANGELNFDRTYRYAFGLGALYRKITIRYSLPYGFYYLTRTVCGNFVRSLFSFDKEKKRFYRMKSRRYLDGFLQYKSL